MLESYSGYYACFVLRMSGVRVPLPAPSLSTGLAVQLCRYYIINVILTIISKGKSRQEVTGETVDDSTMRDWYIECASAFQADERGLIPLSRSNDAMKQGSVRFHREGQYEGAVR